MHLFTNIQNSVDLNNLIQTHTNSAESAAASRYVDMSHIIHTPLLVYMEYGNIRILTQTDRLS